MVRDCADAATGGYIPYPDEAAVEALVAAGHADLGVDDRGARQPTHASAMSAESCYGSAHCRVPHPYLTILVTRYGQSASVNGATSHGVVPTAGAGMPDAESRWKIP